MPHSALLDLESIKVVATSKQLDSGKCLSMYADWKKVPDSYLIVAVDSKYIAKRLTFEQMKGLFEDLTGDPIRRASHDEMAHHLTRVIKAMQPIDYSSGQLLMKLGGKFKVSKKPIPDRCTDKLLRTGAKRPRAGSTTGMVWDICDRVYSMSNPPKMPEKEAIIEMCANEGINRGTAATQFSKWKSTK